MLARIFSLIFIVNKCGTIFRFLLTVFKEKLPKYKTISELNTLTKACYIKLLCRLRGVTQKTNSQYKIKNQFFIYQQCFTRIIENQDFIWFHAFNIKR